VENLGIHDNDSDASSAESEAEFSNSTQQTHGGHGEGLSGRNVVKTLMQKLGGRGHIVTTDNYFTLVPLFMDLLENRTMAIGTLRGNRKYVPRSMFSKEVTKRKEIGWMDYRMHREGKVCCVVWKDKKLVVLLSTHTHPVAPPREGNLCGGNSEVVIKKCVQDRCI
jgi:hypothetical protein